MGIARKAKIHESVAVGDRLSSSRLAHATITHRKYEPMKIVNHGISIPAAYSNRLWDDEIVAQLVEYIRIPAKSPHFDPRWKEHGHIDAVVAQARRWVE